MRYPQASAMSNALLREILVEASSDAGPGDDLQRASTRLLSDCALGFWTERSERITIISWAPRAGIDSETRKRWGRWLPKVDESYVRTTRVMIEEAQARVASAARRSIYNNALFDEGLVLTELEAHLRGRGANDAETARQAWLLQGCRPVTACRKRLHPQQSLATMRKTILGWPWALLFSVSLADATGARCTGPARVTGVRGSITKRSLLSATKRRPFCLLRECAQTALGRRRQAPMLLKIAP